MPLFEINKTTLTPVAKTNFPVEKDIQTLIEKNLSPVFNCRFVATEFSTGAVHSGRIDSLALSEENNPVIIEYKKIESSELINQSLFYLHWIFDHKGDFEMAAKNTLGNDVKVDWSDVRVICIAPSYKKYDIHAVQVMGANIELWTYRLYKNNVLHLEEILQATRSSVSSPIKKNSGVMSGEKKNASGLGKMKKTLAPVYTFDRHLTGKSETIKSLLHNIQDFIIGLDPSIEEVPKKHYIAYKVSQNIICVEPQVRCIKLFLKLRPTEVKSAPKFYRNVLNIGHWGTGESEFTIQSEDEFELVKPFIIQAYNKFGG
ncbi:MAG: DUF5655 domain-containing protein [Kiritimatiellales bacterium]